jgi:hypothetical protein
MRRLGSVDFRRLLVKAILLIAQVPIAVLTSAFLFDIAVQIVDEGGGASGVEAVRQVTVEDRLQLGLEDVCLGLLGVAAMVGLNRWARPSWVIIAMGILVALLGWVWATDSPSPASPNGELPGVLASMSLVVGLVGGLILVRQSASRRPRDRRDV